MNRPIPLYKLENTHQSTSLNSGNWIDGVHTHALESELKKYLGVEYVILTNSGTSALLAAYWVLRDHFSTVATDPYTFPATYQPARVLGYDVRFERTFLVDKPSSPKEKHTVEAVTHLFGQPSELVVGHDGPFIEDACQSFGAAINGKKVGTFGMVGCFSFYPTKTLHTCGHGGALVTNDKRIYEEAKIFIESGRRDGVMTTVPALNLRIDEIKAEFLLEELANYDRNTARRREIVRYFQEVIPSRQPLLDEKTNASHVYSVCNLLVGRRDAFRAYLDSKMIQSAIYYNSDILPEDMRKGYLDITDRIVAIPCRHNLSDDEVKTIRNSLKEWFYDKENS